MNQLYQIELTQSQLDVLGYILIQNNEEEEVSKISSEIFSKIQKDAMWHRLTQTKNKKQGVQNGIF